MKRWLSELHEASRAVGGFLIWNSFFWTFSAANSWYMAANNSRIVAEILRANRPSDAHRLQIYREILFESRMFGIAGICLSSISIFLVFRRLRAFNFARHWRAGLCVACHYDLSGNASGVCPECGTKIAPMLPQMDHAAKEAGLSNFLEGIRILCRMWR
jgi:hypothetical protein